jgi:class 3 adenylate cyclase/predicted ATPase
LTVMFCDLVGSTALSTRHDPEDLRDLIGDYHRAVRKAVGRFDGFVAKYMGDGVLIYFGYPQAHEDDAERAVRAGLAVVEAVGQLPARENLSVRLGIATGLAVVGDLIGEGAAQERGVVGETPNLAARLQALSAPNTLVIGEATRRQIGGLFDLEDLGPQQLAGFDEPQHAWRVLSESGEVSRFEALRSGETPLVGREEELELLLRRWQQAKSGEGRVVLLSGEPGIGKSRLTAAMLQQLEQEPHTLLRYFCSPHHQDSALYPSTAQLEHAAGFTRDDDAEAKRDKLVALLAPAAETGDISVLIELLSLSGGERFPRLDLNPQQRKSRTLAALTRQLEGLAQSLPILMIFEDLHWIDPTSRELLDLVFPRLERMPIFLIATYRPDFQPPWAGQAHVTVLTLNRLGRSDGAAMVRGLSGNAALLTPDVVAEILERTDGVPLFVEEMTKAVLEAGSGRGLDVVAAVPADRVGVPATLHASLMERLDRLGPEAKQVAQIGAAIGREFSYELVAALGDLTETSLLDALKRLVGSGLIFEHGTPPSAEYLFKHALVQDAAYGTLLLRTRGQLHARIATTLEARFPDRTTREPEMLARHYTEAQQPDRACDYWFEAGKRAVERSANLEAITHLTRALAALGQLSESAERDRRELAIQTTIGTSLIAAHGFAAPQVAVAFNRARALGKRIGDVSALSATLFGQWAFYFVGGDFRMMQQLAAEARQAANTVRDDLLDMTVHRFEGVNALYSGDFDQVRGAFEAVRRIYDPDRHRLPSAQYWYMPWLNIMTYQPVTDWILGYPDQALTSQAAAYDFATQMNQPALEAIIRVYAGVGLDEFLLDVPGLRANAKAIIELAEQHNLMHYFWLNGQLTMGWVMAREGEAEAGLELMRRSVTERGATEARWYQPRYLCMLAESYLWHERAEEGLIAVAEADEHMTQTDQYIWAAEIKRVEGELRCLSRAPPDEAETCFQRALTIAREQKARSFELRAATSLARLWRDHGRHSDAHALLTPVYGWFTEGFDTADLKEAKTLLKELA